MCSTLADQGKRVIVAGLDQDYLGKPFEPMPQLLAIAEYITKTLAICMVCGAPANHTQRLVASSERVLVGAPGTYEARCRHCFDPHPGAVKSSLGLRRVLKRWSCCPRSSICSASASWWRTSACSTSSSVSCGSDRTALLTWPGRRPPFYRLFLLLGAVLALLIVYKLAVLRQHPTQVFGETMMLVYYVYALPLSLRIGRGFYEDGIWADGGFMPYSHIGGLTWREDDTVDAGADAPHARSSRASWSCRSPYYGAGAPAAARQDRRARHPLHRQVTRSRGARRARRRVALSARRHAISPR